MADRPRFFDDLAGVAGGAFSALAGIREELEATVRARVEEAIRRLDLVKREDMEAVSDMAANARAGQEAAEARIAALEARIAKLEAGQGADAISTQAVPSASASEVAPGTMPHAGHPSAPVEQSPSEVTPAAMPPGSGAPGSVMPPSGGAT